MRRRTEQHISKKLVVLTTCFILFVCSTAYPSEIDNLTTKKNATSQALFSNLDEYTLACADYQEAINEREQAQVELEETTGRIEVLRSELTQRAASMYRQGRYSALDLLLGSATFQEFTTTWDLLRLINEKHTAQIEEMRSLKAQQRDLIKMTEEKEARAAALIQEIDTKTAVLNAQIADLDSSIEALNRQSEEAARIEALKIEETKKIAEVIVESRPTVQYPMPANLGDGAWDDTISSLLAKYGLGDNWLPIIRNIIWRESSNNPSANSGYYVGLCQFSPAWEPPRGWSGVGDWRYDPVASIERMVQLIADTGGLGSHWAGTNY